VCNTLAANTASQDPLLLDASAYLVKFCVLASRSTSSEESEQSQSRKGLVLQGLMTRDRFAQEYRLVSDLVKISESMGSSLVLETREIMRKIQMLNGICFI
jgi:hypothetical protein